MDDDTKGVPITDEQYEAEHRQIIAEGQRLILAGEREAAVELNLKFAEKHKEYLGQRSKRAREAFDKAFQPGTVHENLVAKNYVKIGDAILEAYKYFLEPEDSLSVRNVEVYDWLKEKIEYYKTMWAGAENSSHNLMDIAAMLECGSLAFKAFHPFHSRMKAVYKEDAFTVDIKTTNSPADENYFLNVKNYTFKGSARRSEVFDSDRSEQVELFPDSFNRHVENAINSLTRIEGFNKIRLGLIFFDGDRLSEDVVRQTAQIACKVINRFIWYRFSEKLVSVTFYCNTAKEAEILQGICSKYFDVAPSLRVVKGEK